MTDNQETPEIEKRVEGCIEKLEKAQGRKLELEQSLHTARQNRDNSPEGSSTRSIAEMEYEEIYEQLEMLENQMKVLESDYAAVMIEFCDQFNPKPA